MRTTLLLLVVSIFSFSATPYAADVDSLGRLFTQEFIPGYESGRCLYNTRFFTKKARSQNIDLRGAMYLAITGYGDLWYYHGRSRTGEPSSGVWFYHYVLAIPTDGRSHADFSADRNYVVIDFDYGSQPLLVDLKTYLRHQFMPSSVRNDESRLEGNFELAFLKLTAYDADRLVDRLNSSAEATSAVENSTLLFKDWKFKDFYRALPR